MVKTRKLIKEGKVLTSSRLQKLAGIVKEQNEANQKLETGIRNLTKMWLKKSGKIKVTDYVEELLEEYLSDGKNVDADERGSYSYSPDPEDVVDGDDLFQKFFEDIAKFAPGELGQKLLDDELPPEVYNFIEEELFECVEEVFEGSLDEVKAKLDDYGSSDPYKRYGVSKSFF